MRRAASSGRRTGPRAVPRPSGPAVGLLLLAAAAWASQFGLLNFTDISNAEQLRAFLARDGPVLIYVWQPPCPSCEALKEQTFTRPEVAQALQGVRLAAVNAWQWIPAIEAQADGQVYVYEGGQLTGINGTVVVKEGRLLAVPASGRSAVPIQYTPTILLGEARNGTLHLKLYMVGAAPPQEFIRAVQAARGLGAPPAAPAAAPLAAMLAISFAAGAASVLSPCVLPVLAAAGTALLARRNMAKVMAGMVASFALLGLLLAAAAGAAALARQALYLAGAAVLTALGLISLVDRLNAAFAAWASRIQTRAYRLAKGSGDLALGMALGAVWMPCIAPIFGTVAVANAVASAIAGNLPAAAASTTAYAAGLATVIYAATAAARRGARLLKWARYGRAAERAAGAAALALAALMLGEAAGLHTLTALAGAA